MRVTGSTIAILCGGFLGQVETTTFGITSSVLPVDMTGAQTSIVPINIIDNGARTGELYGVYLQDEWRIFPALTLNSGLRFDGVNEFTKETQVSPRVNLVLKATDETSFHAGYSRYFVPPPFELVTPTAISLFNNTTAAPAVQQDDTVRAERSHYFDVGINQVILPHLTVGLDGYYKLARDLIDEGQFGAPIILTAFNYARAHITGAVLTISYDEGPWSIYGNAAYSRALGTDIVSAQFNFAPDELASRSTTSTLIMIRHGRDRAGSPTHLIRTQNTKRVSRWISSPKAACARARQRCQMARPCRNMRRSMRASSKSSILGSGQAPNFV